MKNQTRNVTKGVKQREQKNNKNREEEENRTL